MINFSVLNRANASTKKTTITVILELQKYLSKNKKKEKYIHQQIKFTFTYLKSSQLTSRRYGPKRSPRPAWWGPLSQKAHSHDASGVEASYRSPRVLAWSPRALRPFLHSSAVRLSSSVALADAFTTDTDTGESRGPTIWKDYNMK